jgi:hypothetical protein
MKARTTTEAPPRRWTMEIPGWAPTLDNRLVYAHWSVARRRKRRDAEVVGMAALVYGVPRATGRRRLRLTIRGRFGRFPDDPAPLKSLWDALVKNGLLVDDSREWLEMAWPPTFERGPKRTVIELEDVEGV